MFWNYSYALNNGSTASYWKLVSLYVNVTNGTAMAKVQGFFDQAAYEAGKLMMLEQEIYFPVSQLDTEGTLFLGVKALAESAQAIQFPNA